MTIIRDKDSKRCFENILILPLGAMKLHHKFEESKFAYLSFTEACSGYLVSSQIVLN